MSAVRVCPVHDRECGADSSRWCAGHIEPVPVSHDLDPAALASLAECINIGAWLRAAYARRRSEHWPPFADAMESVVLSRLILQEAQRPTLETTIKRPEVVRPDPPPAGVSSPVTQPRSITVTKSENRGGSSTPQALDFKSRAAGERPEQDDS